MSMPFYVSPEQAMKDKADYARKGIARGRNSVVLQYDEGILFVAAEPLQRPAQDQRDLRPDRVRRGRPVQRVREPAGRRGPATPTSRGYQYDRADVTARGLANWYAQILGTIFTESNKPYEVEIVVAEVGETARRRPDVPDHLRRLGRRRARLRRHGRPGRTGRRRCSRSATARACRSRPRWRRDRGAGRPGQRRPHRDQRQPAGGGRAHARAGAPHVPPAHRAPGWRSC